MPGFMLICHYFGLFLTILTTYKEFRRKLNRRSVLRGVGACTGLAVLPRVPHVHAGQPSAPTLDMLIAEHLCIRMLNFRQLFNLAAVSRYREASGLHLSGQNGYKKPKIVAY